MTQIRSTARWLILGLTLLLWLQWPLREWVHAYSQTANDIGQIVFALYAALAISEATRSSSHLSAHGTSQSETGAGNWRSLAITLCVAPWALFMLWTTLPHAWASTLGLERFGEAFTPGYFLVRIALVLLAALVLWDATTSLFKR